MELSWESEKNWFDRTYTIDHDGQTVEIFDEQPTLDTLREFDRQLGEPTERLDLWQAGLLCTDCDSDINKRFAATPSGEILCWDCAMSTDSTDKNGLTTNTDPTKSVMSESYLHTKSLCDHVINVATGCRHGCEFCYVPTTPAIDSRDDMLNEQADVEDPQRDWGSYLLYRDDLPERLANVLEERDPDERKQTDRGRGVVMLSSGTDCYQDRRTAQITRGAVAELIKHDLPVRILTRSPSVVRDIDLFKTAGNRITVGSSIPSFDETLVRAIEPNAPPPKKRWNALDCLQQAGVPVFVSMSPTYPTMTEDEFDNLLGHFRALGEVVVFHEPINPRGANFQQCLDAAQQAGYDAVVEELQRMQDDHQYWVEYALEQINTVQKIATRYEGLEIHSWPDDELVKSTSGQLRTKLKAMQQAVSPEEFLMSDPVSDPEQSELVTGEKSIRQII